MLETKFSIGGMVICVNAPDDLQLNITPAYAPFLSDLAAEISLSLRKGEVPPVPVSETLRYSDTSVCEYAHSNSRHIFACFNSGDDPKPYMTAVMDDAFANGDMYVDVQGQETARVAPLEYPFDELLASSALSRGRGVLIHACGIAMDEEGVLFVGASGQGKSTIANIFKGEKNAVLLNDDRIIVRKENNDFFIYGTPWHGDVRACCNKKVPLKKIFFLRHGRMNSMVKTSGMDALMRLFTSTFPPFWDKRGVEFTLDFCSDLAANIPCHELTFLPDTSVIDFVRGKS